MKNVTVTMSEAVLHEARIAAAREGKSLSKFISEIVQDRVGRSLTQKEAIDLFLAGPDWASGGVPMPRREEFYEERFRRYERPDLRKGRGFSEEGGAGDYVAHAPDHQRGSGD